MSTLRYDPAHRPGQAQTGRSRRSPRMWPREHADETAGAGPGAGPPGPDANDNDGDDAAWEPGRRAGPVLSVVVPARDEADAIGALVAEIARALRPLRDGRIARAGRPRLGGFEIIIVDDGSTDRTPEVLEGLAADYPELRAILLRPGVGQSSATVAGIRAARGEWIATLDADLQNDPADLVRLWEALPGHDVALGWRQVRHDTWSRRAISRWANRVRNAVLGQSIRDTGCSVRIFRREPALRLPAFRGVHRFLGPLLLREGCRLVQVPVGHRPRPHGKSHYNIWNRSAQVVVDLIGVAWLLRRPIAFRVARAWDAAGPPSAGTAHGDPPVGAAASSWPHRRVAEG